MYNVQTYTMIHTFTVILYYKKGCTRLAVASDKVYQLLAHGRWFSPGTPASSTTKTGRHDIAEILLKVVLKHQKSKSNQSYITMDLQCINIDKDVYTYHNGFTMYKDTQWCVHISKWVYDVQAYTMMCTHHNGCTMYSTHHCVYVYIVNPVW
jgi:hypothetical protein